MISIFLKIVTEIAIVNLCMKEIILRTLHFVNAYKYGPVLNDNVLFFLHIKGLPGLKQL